MGPLEVEQEFEVEMNQAHAADKDVAMVPDSDPTESCSPLDRAS